MMKKVISALTLSSAILAVGFLGAQPANAEEVREGDNTFYLVESGDTLSKIAGNYGTSFLTVQANNQDTVSNADLIFVGQKLLVGGVDFDASKTVQVQETQPVAEQPVVTEETPEYTAPVQETQPVTQTTANDGSPQYAAERMASATGTSVDTWLYIIQAESGNDPHVVNSIGCYGYFQIHPVHGMPYGASVDTQIEYAISIYNSQGFSAWEVM